jgi:SAM-dependent methyltransferase
LYKHLPTFNTRDELWHGGQVPAYFIRHARKIATFIDESPEPVLDLGEVNPKIAVIAREKGLSFQSCDNIDFDSEPIPGRWGTILCFEILEHLYNPLFALESMRRSLLPGGVVYLSTPGRPKFLWTDQHFHEIDDQRIAWLFRRAGFEVERRERVPIRREWWWHLRGVRPFFRMFTNTRVYKLRAAPASASS